jgi:hypothetical protein
MFRFLRFDLFRFLRFSLSRNTKRQPGSGLRSILTRDPENDIAQNEPIFNITRRLRAMYPRTMRSLNCAVTWGFVSIEDGAIVPRSTRRSVAFSKRYASAKEAREIIRAAEKLGTWAGQLTAFEYFTILGVEFHQ